MTCLQRARRDDHHQVSKSRHSSRTKLQNQTSTIEIRANTETYLLCMFQRLVSGEPRDFPLSMTDRQADYRMPLAHAHRGIITTCGSYVPRQVYTVRVMYIHVHVQGVVTLDVLLIHLRPGS